ncbi:MAG: hypothetical protein OZSIB_4107 [Candidatus Ozemobacter sibiricus]|uniref:Uncharacterized protein n=1 Tax=Candidatus Ozemobacter sibiricus TaxID=2268124 RepID=A0A367ZND0_9BACT|nr:MAG: hypothetical protein OZSIB_4107 [Candidatus Ozemobacter sibiricus]
MLCADQERSVREVREDTAVIGAIGWGEVGTEKVADVLVQYDHKGPVLTLTTSRGAVLRASPEHLCFGRLNPLCRQHYLYLMERSSLGFRVGLTSDLQRDLVAVQNLKLDLFHQHEVVDRLWIIEATDSLPRATFLEKLCTFKYGLPNIPFTGRHLESDLPEELVLELFNQIDTPSRAHQLLMDWYMFQDSPHITLRLAGAQAGGSNAVQFTIFGGAEKNRRQTNYTHLIRIDSNVELKRAEHQQFKRRMGARGMWNLEVTRDDLEEAQLFVKTLACLDNLEVVRKIQLTKKAPFYLLPASHLKVGMNVPIMGPHGIEEDSIVSITVDDVQGPLYDFRLNGLSNYVVGQWVVGAWQGNPARLLGKPDEPRL